MSLREIIRQVEGQALTLSLYNVDASTETLDPVREYFEPQLVTLRRAGTDGGVPRNFAVLHDGATFLAAAAIDDVARAVGSRTGVHTRPVDGEFPAILEHVDNTTFVEYGKRRMIIASREIETNAYRGGEGTLHAGFQRLSRLRPQWDAYAKLAARGLDVSVYGVPDWRPPDAALSFRGAESEEIANSWFVVYDGAGDDRDKCALVASEVGDNVYSGFWTYRADIVDAVLDHLDATYGTD